MTVFNSQTVQTKIEEQFSAPIRKTKSNEYILLEKSALTYAFSLIGSAAGVTSDLTFKGRWGFSS